VRRSRQMEIGRHLPVQAAGGKSGAVAVWRKVVWVRGGSRCRRGMQVQCTQQEGVADSVKQRWEV